MSPQGETAQGETTREIKWRMVKDKFEITVVDGVTFEATLRENNTLALKYLDVFGKNAIKVLRKKTDGR